MEKTELETIVMGIIKSIENDIEDWKVSESLKISDLEKRFGDLLEQLESLDDLQRRLRKILRELEQTSTRLNNL